ncbi:MAG: nuclear transport factor 2 family protein [Hyphomicrobiales bacterium]|nr:nuclear transport factor 2 family protein [Hyphomicrobiales bacterium]
MLTNKPRSFSNLVGGALLAITVAAVGTIANTAMVATQAYAQESMDLDAVGQAAINAWIEAIASGDQEKVRALSAPEFQIVRGDGSAHALEFYLTDLPVLVGIPVMKNVFATATDNQMVVRYTIDVVKDIEGKSVDAFGPRLTVLRKEGDVWLVVAHANFATVVQEPPGHSVDNSPE